MSADVSVEAVPEANAEEAVDPGMVAIRARMKLSSAVRNYVNANEQYESASQDLNKSVQAIREVIEPSTTIVVQLHYGRHYLLKSDDQGDFTVESIDVI